MDELVKACIKGRLDAIYMAYDINDEDIKKKITDFSMKMEDLGYSCKDNMEFETKFADTLSQEYNELFALIVAKCPAKTIEHTENHVMSDAEYIADSAGVEARCMVDDLTMPARRKARQEAYDVARDVPVLGEVMTAKQHFDFFSRFKRKKKDKEEKDAE